jgi:hypothetical protein
MIISYYSSYYSIPYSSSLDILSLSILSSFSFLFFYFVLLFYSFISFYTSFTSMSLY